MLLKPSSSVSCRILFFIISFYIGMWTIRVPNIKDQLDTDYLGIGYIMGFFSFGSILIMIFASQIINKYSSRLVIGFAGTLQAILWIFAPFINELIIFFLYAFIFGLSWGMFEVAINLQASNIEKMKNKSMMSGFHAFFSLGILSGSFLTSIMLEMNVSFIKNIIIFVSFLLPLNIFYAFFLNYDEKSNNNKNKTNIFFIWPSFIVVLVIFTLADSLTEGGMDSWGALYMRDAIKVEGFKIGIATIFFNLFMVVGRLIGDKVRDKLGLFKFIILLFSTSIIGLMIIFNFNTITSSIIGFSIVGMGISSIIPLAYSLAGKIEGIESSVGISIISISTYGCFMLAPALLGFVAKYLGINYVFLPMLLMSIFCILLAIIFRKKFI